MKKNPNLKSDQLKTDPRRTALEILLGCQKKHSTLDQSLGHAEKALSSLSQKDRNLTHALAFGVLRNRARLDHTIQNFSKIPFEKMDAKVIHILRLGLYQLFFMDRIPDFAAINTSVELAKKKTGKRSSGFVHAILRSALRKGMPALPPMDKHPVEHLSLAHSLPSWWVARWLKTQGPEKTQELCTRINEIPPVTLRVNTLKTNVTDLVEKLGAAGHTATPARHAPHGLHLKNPGAIDQLPGFKEGLFQIQDEAAQLTGLLLDPQPGENILDACAGLGGKTCHLAQLMDNKGQITAMDLTAKKLTNLEEETQRLGISMVSTRAYDLKGATIKNFPDFFDRVLLDAPCSGLGVMRRNPDTKWKRLLGDVQRLAGQQKRLLNAAANLVRPGGLLVFAVCSCEMEENMEVIQAFLKKRKDFILDTEFTLAAPQVKEAIPMPGHFLRTYPDAAHMDGFFAARLKRLPK